MSLSSTWLRLIAFILSMGLFLGFWMNFQLPKDLPLHVHCFIASFQSLPLGSPTPATSHPPNLGFQMPGEPLRPFRPQLRGGGSAAHPSAAEGLGFGQPLPGKEAGWFGSENRNGMNGGMRVPSQRLEVIFWHSLKICPNLSETS